MTITVDGTFENGQLKFKQAVALAEGTPVRVTITPLGANRDPLEAVIGICRGGPRDGAENHDKYVYESAQDKPVKAAKKAIKHRK